jgi:hypothetical protein
VFALPATILLYILLYTATPDAAYDADLFAGNNIRSRGVQS